MKMKFGIQACCDLNWKDDDSGVDLEYMGNSSKCVKCETKLIFHTHNIISKFFEVLSQYTNLIQTDRGMT